MIVVSDTSPLNYLVLISAIDVLPKLFHDIHAPPAVIAELLHPRTSDPVKLWASNPPTWLKVRAPSVPFHPASVLDPGEAAALALASELKADALLIDEKKGRRIAKENGFTTLGTLTILELASQKNLLDLSTVLIQLRQTSFQIAQSYIDAALQRAAAHKRN